MIAQLWEATSGWAGLWASDESVAERVGPRAKDFKLLAKCSSALDGRARMKKSQAELGVFNVWTGTESNCRHKDFQSSVDAKNPPIRFACSIFGAVNLSLLLGGVRSSW